MSAPASRHASAVAELERLAESGALDALAWAMTGVLISAAEQMAPEAKSPAEAAWIVARQDSTAEQLADVDPPDLTNDDAPTVEVGARSGV